MTDRDDFTQQTKETLARRVGYRCSNPNCRKPTSGPRTDPSKAVNIGVAAHITAASEGGPRYDPSLTSEQRKHPDNGIWLCQNCAKLIDNDADRYHADLLHEWKHRAEQMALDGLEHKVPQASADQGQGRSANRLEIELDFLRKWLSHAEGWYNELTAPVTDLVSDIQVRLNDETAHAYARIAREMDRKRRESNHGNQLYNVMRQTAEGELLSPDVRRKLSDLTERYLMSGDFLKIVASHLGHWNSLDPAEPKAIKKTIRVGWKTFSDNKDNLRDELNAQIGKTQAAICHRDDDSN